MSGASPALYPSIATFAQLSKQQSINRLQYKRFLISPKIGILGQKIFPHHYLDNSHVTELLRETLDTQASSQTSMNEQPSAQITSGRNLQTEKLISKLLTTNLNEIHKNYFKYLSFNERNKANTEDEEVASGGADLNTDSSTSLNPGENFFVQRPSSKARVVKTSDQTKIIYQLSKIHSSNKKRNYFSSSNTQSTPTFSRTKKSNSEYKEIEMKTLGLVDFQEEQLLNEI